MVNRRDRRHELPVFEDVNARRLHRAGRRDDLSKPVFSGARIGSDRANGASSRLVSSLESGPTRDFLYDAPITATATPRGPAEHVQNRVRHPVSRLKPSWDSLR